MRVSYYLRGGEGIWHNQAFNEQLRNTKISNYVSIWAICACQTCDN